MRREELDAAGEYLAGEDGAHADVEESRGALHGADLGRAEGEHGQDKGKDEADADAEPEERVGEEAALDGIGGGGVMRSGMAALMASRTTWTTMVTIRIQASSRMGRPGREPSVRYQWPHVIEVETAPIATVPASSARNTPA